MLNRLAVLRHAKFRGLEKVGPDLHSGPRHFTVAVRRSVKSSSPTFSAMSNTRPVPIEASSLREWVLSQQSSSKSESSTSSSTIPKTFKVVDVRDDDYQGGNIPGSMNIPSRQLNSRVDSLVDDLKDNEAVVFTCALSQQRGPNAAQKYLNRLNAKGVEGQKVYVLKDGIYNWQALYGKEKALTENWNQEFWEYYL